MRDLVNEEIQLKKVTRAFLYNLGCVCGMQNQIISAELFKHTTEIISKLLNFFG